MVFCGCRRASAANFWRCCATDICKAPYPGFIEPELATSVDRVPSGARWIHEIKFDGYRVQVHLIPFPHQDDLTIYGNDVIDWTSFGLRSI